MISAYQSGDLAQVADALSEREQTRGDISDLREDIADSELSACAGLPDMKELLQKLQCSEKEILNGLQHDTEKMALDAAEAVRRRIRATSYQKSRHLRKQATAYDRRG